MNFSDKTTVIFDLDGLLVDSEPLWDKTHDVFFTKYHLPSEPDLHEFTHGAGITDNIRLFQDRLGLRGNHAELVNEYRDIFYSFALKNHEIHLMPGAKHLLHCLSENSYQLAIATGGHPSDKIEEILKQLDVVSFFPTLVSSDMVEKGKPDPAVYLKTADVLGVSPRECVVLEDSVNGTKAGKAAGMSVIGVNPDKEYQKKLASAGADLVVFRLDELIDMFAGGCCGGDCERE